MSNFVIPVKTGIQIAPSPRAYDLYRRYRALGWIPAFAGMTVEGAEMTVEGSVL